MSASSTAVVVIRRQTTTSLASSPRLRAARSRTASSGRPASKVCGCCCNPFVRPEPLESWVILRRSCGAALKLANAFMPSATMR
jgi:hypothetical protein